MIVYWLMFLIPAVMSIIQPPRRDGGYVSLRWISPRSAIPTVWLLTAVFYVVVIGFRYEVGADWYNYLANYEQIGRMTAPEIIRLGDPAFQILSLVSYKLDAGIVGVNLFSALAFISGLMVFCGHSPRPWLGLAVSVPYLVVVVGMGYTRQSLAIGLVLFGLKLIGKGQIGKFGLIVLAATAFHRSAVVAGLAGLVVTGWRRFLPAVTVLLASVIALIAFVTDSISVLYANYVETLYESQGAILRVAMCVVPAVIFVWKRRLFVLNHVEKQLLTWFSYGSLIMFLMVLVIPSTAFLDRFALYLLPVQIMVFSRLPDVFGRLGRPNEGFVIAVLGYYAFVLFVWLNYADHAQYWLPYRWAL